MLFTVSKDIYCGCYFMSGPVQLGLEWGNLGVLKNAPLGSQLSWDSSGAILGCRKMLSVELGLEWGNFGVSKNATCVSLSWDPSGASLGCRNMPLMGLCIFEQFP